MLYQNQGPYTYLYGFNWRAVITLLIVVPINLPGLMHAINSSVDIGNYAYFCKYKILQEVLFTSAPPMNVTTLDACPLTRLTDKASWLTATFISVVIYLGLSLVWPPTESIYPRDESRHNDDEVDATANGVVDHESHIQDKYSSQKVRVLDE